MPEEQVILQKGLEAFAELGYDRASARELAGRLGVSHNFINDRYGSKAAFWRAVVDHALTSQLAELGGEAAPEGDDAERLRWIIVRFYRTAVDRPWVDRLCTDEFSRDSERLDYLYQHYIGPTLALIAPSVAALTSAGRLPEVPLDVLFFALISPVAGLTQEPLAQRLGRDAAPSPEDRVATAEILANLVVDGFLSAGEPLRSE
ncbi:TetR/AcrR family transcriptional regulator [Streptomyces sp. NPDC088354]|uniref:TetR/AcrR family transcriptional regulator n=1 Tax=unclassified Streptomyces TaxID=2593676 RepID=UPI0029BF6855|nr:TetR/AcrR family transcriptional regulator [Streptomyces sp. MI02-7b]MDX3074061.1 TetR/AcrR family transcriptional regulator [Streptomyces sp. MI02-7b]